MLLGGLPSNVTAIVLDEPADNLTCQVRSWTFPTSSGTEQRGVISWQCVRSLAAAADPEDLCRRMNTLNADEARRVGTPVYRLHVIGSRKFGALRS